MTQTSVQSFYSIQYRFSTLRRDWYNLVDKEKTEYGKEKIIAPEKTTRPPRRFCTDSTYSGQTDTLGFSGKGTYTYPHGVKYEGSFFDGQFEGEGSLIYPNGYKILGTWRKGKMIRDRFIFEDELEVTHPWDYLDFPDRTFYGEGEKFHEYAKDAFDNIPIGDDYYETRDGIYDPFKTCVHDKYLKIVRILTPEEERKITQAHRAGIGHYVGYRPDLYECCTSRFKDEVESTQRRQMDRLGMSELTLFNPCPDRSL